MDKNQRKKRLIEIGSRIRKAREGHGLNLHKLALLSGISTPALSLIETGKRDLRITTLCQIAAALRVAAGDLLDDRTEEVQVDDMSKDEGYDLGDYT